jgi:predicted NUDIX family NTP pyrophosphohydrolase
VSNTFSLEWPKGSGVLQNYPEIDDARWFTESEARTKLVKGQVPIIDALIERLGGRVGERGAEPK